VVSADEEGTAAAAPPADAFTAEQAATMATGREKYEYQAEVQRLMDIIINSLYQRKDIFLRELISNASDALDKIRFMAVSDEGALGEGANRQLEIRVWFDREARTLTIRDRGVGMTKADLIANLGTIAKSGTASFAEQLSAGADMSLIGQFGVGFYSAYLAADKGRVVSKHNNDRQYVWESTADNTFTVVEDPRGDTLGRGTEITLFLKEDATEYANEETLRKLIKKYSEFITFPIYLGTAKKDGASAPAPTPEEGDPEAVAAAAAAAANMNWELCNNQKAIWHRKTKDVSDDEYRAFYKATSRDTKDPHAWIHFSAEGEVEFRSILYIPTEVSGDMYDNYYQKSSSLRLYVRKVLISDEFEDLMPRYLNFVKGVVDSDDLPLNVSRENLQQHKILKVMGKKLVRKVLEMIRRLAADQRRAAAAADGVDGGGEEEEEGGSRGKDEPLRADAATAYTKFWEKFGRNIKLGVIEDSSNRSKLAKLLRYRTSRSGKEGWRSLDEYVADMLPGQKHIYFIAGESFDAVADSPFLERLLAKGLEVVYMTEPIDEYAVQNLPEYEGHRLTSATKEGLVLPGEDALAKKREETYTTMFRPLTDYLKHVYGDKVEKVVVSNRLATSPCILVTSQYGYSANMERIMKSQAFGDTSKSAYMVAKKTMEINPRHPLINELRNRADKDTIATDEQAKDIARLLFDTALMNSGFAMDDPKDFAVRMYRLMRDGLRLESLDLLPEVSVMSPDESADDDDDASTPEVDLDEEDGEGEGEGEAEEEAVEDHDEL